MTLLLRSERLKRFRGRFAREWNHYWLLVFAAVLLAASAPMLLPLAAKCAFAAELQVGEYCYRMKVTVSNNTETAYNNYPVKLTVPARSFATQGFVREAGWDLRPVAAASLNELDLMAQDMNEESATWWLSMSYIPAKQGATPSVSSGWVYMGNAFVQRDQGVQFLTADYMTTPSTAGLQLTDDWEIRVSMSMLEGDTVGISQIIDKFESASSTGYRLFIDDGNLKGEVGDGSVTGLVSTPYTGADGKFALRFNEPTLSILQRSDLDGGWYTLASSTTAISGDIAINDKIVYVGSSWKGRLFDVEILKGVGAPGSTKPYQWGFNPVDMSQAGNVGDLWTGTAKNQVGAPGPSYSDLAYAFVRPNDAELTSALGPVQVIFTDPAESLGERFADVLGDPTAVNLFEKGPVNTNMPFYDVLETARMGMGMPTDAYWLMFFGGIGALIGLALFQGTRRPEIAAAAPCATMLTAASMGLLAPYVPLLFGLGAAGIWLIGKWGTEA